MASGKPSAALGILAVLLMSSVSAQGTLVDLSDEHISFEIPANWSYERDFDFDGITCDVLIQGPGVALVGFLMIAPWPGAVTNATLYSEMKYVLEGFRNDPEYTFVTVLSAPRNVTTNGNLANDMTMRATSSGSTLRYRSVMFASHEWNRGYALGFICEDSDYSTYSSEIQSVTYSVNIDQKEPSRGLSTVVVVGIVVLIVATVVIVAAIFLMRSKGREPSSTMLPPYLPPPPTPYQPPFDPNAPPPRDWPPRNL